MKFFRSCLDTQKKLLQAADRHWTSLAYKEILSFEQWGLRVKFKLSGNYIIGLFLWYKEEWLECGEEDLLSYGIELLSSRTREQAIKVLKSTDWLEEVNYLVELHFE